MRVPISWLRDYVQLPADADEIVSRLATLGFPGRRGRDAADDHRRRRRAASRRSRNIRTPTGSQVCTIDIGANAR